jgi:hypothetical protein
MWYVRIARLLRGNDDVSTAGMLRAMKSAVEWKSAE